MNFNFIMKEQQATLVQNITEGLLNENTMNISFVRVTLTLRDAVAPVSVNHYWPMYLKDMDIPKGQPDIYVEFHPVNGSKTEVLINVKNGYH